MPSRQWGWFHVLRWSTLQFWAWRQKSSHSCILALCSFEFMLIMHIVEHWWLTSSDAHQTQIFCLARQSGKWEQLMMRKRKSQAHLFCELGLLHLRIHDFFAFWSTQRKLECEFAQAVAWLVSSWLSLRWAPKGTWHQNLAVLHVADCPSLRCLGSEQLLFCGGPIPIPFVAVIMTDQSRHDPHLPTISCRNPMNEWINAVHRRPAM